MGNWLNWFAGLLLGALLVGFALGAVALWALLFHAALGVFR